MLWPQWSNKMIKKLNTKQICEDLANVMADFKEYAGYGELTDKIILLKNIYIYLESLKEVLAKNIVILELKQENLLEQ